MVDLDEEQRRLNPLSSTGPLRELARAFGVDTDYVDWQGAPVSVPDSTLAAVLTAFGVDTSSPSACERALAEYRAREGDRTLPPCVVMRRSRPASVPSGGGRVDLEDGGTRTLPPGHATLPADLPLGYHRLAFDDGATAALIVTPDRLELPPRLRERPGWGLAVQLYSVRSRGSWALGDVADLRTLLAWTAEQGGDFVLTNPVHAGGVRPPLDPSPYLPSSRRFADPLYLRVEALPEYAAVDDATRARIDALAGPLRGTLGDRIERDPVWTAKLAALRLLREAPPPPGRDAEYAAFRKAEGEPLTRFGTWCAIALQHGDDWREWPADLHDPAGDPVAALAGRDAERVDFFCWLQWLLDDQLIAAQHEAVERGLALGVVGDVAVGVSPGGADAWANQDAMAGGISVGAPPDAYSQLGQDWHQPPWRPDRLAELGYAPFREMFEAALRHCGGLRVDHVIGLFRLWWIPAGRPALEGTYVHYDHEALLGVLALEAARAGAVVVGEDLGNVEESARATLHERGMLGTSILWFERDADGAPRPPQQWRPDCLASVTTHDLPPTLGYLAGDHVRLRERLGMLTRPVEQELATARDEHAAWLDELERVGVLAPADRDDPAQVLVALHRFVGLTPAALRAVALTDIVGERRTQNQPGTLDQYPNWQVPLAGPDGVPLLLEDVIARHRDEPGRLGGG